MKSRCTLFFFLFFLPSIICSGQIKQVERFEMEKKNTDDFFTVASVGNMGCVILRDINKPFSFKEKVDGDQWEITALDTALNESWKKELSFDYNFVFKGFDISDGHIFLLFRDGEYERNDYHLMVIDFENGETEEYTIKNELVMELSHIAVMNDILILGGYVRYSPTVVTYRLGDDKFNVIPGFFKDRSDIIDLHTNLNGTFNVVTLEKDYQGFFIRLRTHGEDGEILFERQVNMSPEHRVLSGKSTGFVNGNLVVTGTYGAKSSYYALGLYFAIVKPKGQKNEIKYIPFTKLDNFFNYMRPRRAQR
ncbi:MAG: hypothetical protein R3345_03085, partial [Fulvivirga sp.]|nr:hypothetical protein [Fulvivirga sp.]